ncbi:hypothetical protein LJC04_04615 [Ruminococcaceae bacterium OttesenSCG-928-O06]|nr:hypothetical protein [Ruminococcaceae bacterium OttesenSCG-928-O06]
MKKLLRNILLAFIPVVLYYGVFIAFEPNNYFGLRPDAAGTGIMAVLRRYEKAPQSRIILGDSRLAQLDPDVIAAAGGGQWANLSYGGASLTEQLDLLQWALDTNEGLEEVLFMGSFYTLNAGYNHDRMLVRALNNPFVYMTNLGYNINMLTNLYDHLAPHRETGAGGETQDPADYVYVEYTDPASGQAVPMRDTMARHITEVYQRSRAWQLSEEFGRLLQLIDDCEARGVRFIVVLPPASNEVMDWVVAPLGIQAPMREVLAKLYATGALVLDYEFENRHLLREDQFYDGFHLDLERGLDAWCEMLFRAIAAGGEGASHVA